MPPEVAFLVGGTHSGCGKTTVALALMAAFRARGHHVQPFKIGPDFIDPGFHTHLTGRSSRNLDGWMLSRDYNVERFLRSTQDVQVAIVEGVMGLFDGYSGADEAGSSAEMAKWLGLPVILVVDARSMARSAAALVYGYCRFDEDLRVAGVIFNRVGSPTHYQYLVTAMTASLPDVAVLGCIPRDRQVTLPERHLGLVTADELDLGADWVVRLGDLAEEHIDLDRLFALARWEDSGDSRKGLVKSWLSAQLSRCDSHDGQEADSKSGRAPRCDSSHEVFPTLSKVASDPRLEHAAAGMGPRGVVLAVARDAAFCFYYEDNLDALREAGADLQFFSPLAGDSFPEGTAGVYLGGGYPELHAGRLADHHRFLADVQRAAKEGMPIYAECGGMMVLSRFIITKEGEQYPMAGVLPFGTLMLKRRKALGYTEVLVREPCLLGDVGTRLRGHEFHYSEIVDEYGHDPPVCCYELQARHGKGTVLEGFRVGSVLASYVHVHFGSNPNVAVHWVEMCRRFRDQVDVGGGTGDTAG